MTAPKTLAWPADKIERWAVGRIKNYERNPRVHSEEQIAKIVRSIEEFGWTAPVLVDEEGCLIAGHGRLAAAQQVGLKTIPVLVAEGWTEAKKIAYRIADNQLVIDGRWDESLLKIEMGELLRLDYDVSLTGFNEVQLKVAELEMGDGVERAPETSKTKRTIFLSVPIKKVEQAKKVVSAALKKAGIEHNL